MRRFLARAQAALMSAVEWLTETRTPADEAGRWQRMADHAEQQFELAAIKELSPVEAEQVGELTEHLAVIRTGELPIVLAEVVALPMPTVRERTPAEVFAADPLGAPLADVERSSPFYRSVLDGQADWMSQETLDRLESPTGTWTRGDIDRLLAERAR